jgi:hypothetical protein
VSEKVDANASQNEKIKEVSYSYLMPMTTFITKVSLRAMRLHGFS